MRVEQCGDLLQLRSGADGVLLLPICAEILLEHLIVDQKAARALYPGHRIVNFRPVRFLVSERLQHGGIHGFLDRRSVRFGVIDFGQIRKEGIVRVRERALDKVQDVCPRKEEIVLIVSLPGFKQRGNRRVLRLRADRNLDFGMQFGIGVRERDEPLGSVTLVERHNIQRVLGVRRLVIVVLPEFGILSAAGRRRKNHDDSEHQNQQFLHFPISFLNHF